MNVSDIRMPDVSLSLTVGRTRAQDYAVQLVVAVWRWHSLVPVPRGGTFTICKIKGHAC